MQGIPGETPALVVGAGINAPLAPAARARIARELLAIVRGTTVDALARRDHGRRHRRRGLPPGRGPDRAPAVRGDGRGGEAARQGDRAQDAEGTSPDVCRAIVRSGADARAWSKRALASHDRVATIASGDPSVVLSDVLGVPLDRLGSAVKGNPRAEELLRFVLSPQYLEIRRSLGLEGGT